jgi:hypothetical protein
VIAPWADPRSSCPKIDASYLAAASLPRGSSFEDGVKQVRQYLRNGALERGEVPIPAIGPGDVLVRSHFYLRQRRHREDEGLSGAHGPGRDLTESLLASARALLAAQRSIVERRVVTLEPRFPFAMD